MGALIALMGGLSLWRRFRIFLVDPFTSGSGNPHEPHCVMSDAKGLSRRLCLATTRL